MNQDPQSFTRALLGAVGDGLLLGFIRCVAFGVPLVTLHFAGSLLSRGLTFR